MVFAVGEYSVLKFEGCASPLVPAPTVTSTQEKSLALQPEGFSQFAWASLQFSCCHI